MELTRERKVYVAVLLLAGGAFAADRFVLGGGAGQAKAATPANEPSPSGAAPAMTPSGTRAPSVRERLAAAVGQNQPAGEDAFRAPESWLAAESPAQATPESRPMLKVTSVISGPPPAAVVNGRLVRVGDRLGDRGPESHLLVVRIAPEQGVVRVRLGDSEWDVTLPTMSTEGRERE